MRSEKSSRLRARQNSRNWLTHTWVCSNATRLLGSTASEAARRAPTSVWGRPIRAALLRLSKIWLISRGSEMVTGTTLGSK